jgi:hypothetical protein
MAPGLVARLAALSGAAPTQSEAAPPVAPSGCEVDTSAMLRLTPDKFDQDLKGGWRTIAHRPGCELAAADLIAAYRTAHWGSLKTGDLHTSYWHEGQARARAGRYADAVPLLMAGVDPEGGDGFDDYALGTIAFLHRDLPALEAARARLAALPEPPGFEEAFAKYKAKTNRTLRWPMNLDVLDGLIACFDKPYRDAYGCEVAKPAAKPN